MTSLGDACSARMAVLVEDLDAKENVVLELQGRLQEARNRAKTDSARLLDCQEMLEELQAFVEKHQEEAETLQGQLKV